jgi:hypothetical protein
VDGNGATIRILVGERALAHVGDDFGVAKRVARDTRSRWKPSFAEELEASEIVAQRVRSIPGMEGEPCLALATLVVVTLTSST